MRTSIGLLEVAAPNAFLQRIRVKMKGLVFAQLAASVIACALIGAARAEPCTLAQLGWMAAAWTNEQDPQARESWFVAPGNVLMGSAFEIPPGKSGYAEIMTVRDDDGDVRMLLRHFDGSLSRAWEERTAPMVFKAASCASQSVTFEGQGANVGERMTYSRSDDRLLIVADFLHAGKTDHHEWRMIRDGR